MKLNYLIWSLVFAGVSFLAVTQVVLVDGQVVTPLANWFAGVSIMSAFGSLLLMFAAFATDY